MIKSANLGELLIYGGGLPLFIYFVTILFAFWWKSKPLKGPDKWYFLSMIAYLFSFVWFVLCYSKTFVEKPSLDFIPINLTFFIGPMLFQFSKMKLYESARFRGKDIKHFILPLGHISFYCFAFLLPPAQKNGLYLQEYMHLYRPYEEASFGIIIFLYCYFSYRFIKHEQWSIKPQTRKSEIIKISWMQRFLKLFFIGSWVYLFNGLFALVNTFFLKISIQNNYLELLSIFVFMISMGWLGFHAVIMKALPKDILVK
jgi:hypothetical protein